MTDSNSLPPASAPGPFEVVVTDDGSYTARIGAGETMHSMRGALGETVYIYGSAFERIHQMLHAEAKTPPFLSLGLGLGFVEIIAAAVAVTFETPLSGESFELDPRLIQSFKSLMGLLMGGVNFSGLVITVGAAEIKSGAFVQTIIDFLIIASVIFLIVKASNKMKKPEPVAEPVIKECPHCFSIIPIKATRCPTCTSELK